MYKKERVNVTFLPPTSVAALWRLYKGVETCFPDLSIPAHVNSEPSDAEEVNVGLVHKMNA
jgi:hypothetical protein